MKIAIIGGGPSGSVCATLLAQRGHEVAVFDEGGRPEHIAGESLVPGVIPLFRRMGIEDQVAAIGVRKPGVTFFPAIGKEFAFSFSSLPRKFPAYAYNVPRPAFDRILEASAAHAGALMIPHRANLIAEGDKLHLSQETLASAGIWNGRQPDFLIDSSGRRRLAARLLNIKADVGPRRDVSHFAHYEGFDPERPSGQVRINRLANGWSWRIPLQGKMSFGVVMDQKAAAALGKTPEERLEAAMRNDPLLSSETRGAKRISQAETYANYQLVSTKGVGENWASVGDAFGFVDPMLSPGMLLALQSAELLDGQLSTKPLEEALQVYSTKMTESLNARRDLIDYFYDGRIFELQDRGREFQTKLPFLPLGFIETFMSANMSGMASGFTTAEPWSRGVLKYVERFVLGDSPFLSRYAIA
ncbi:MAG: NAD(P)/FAD-dependent oxidoreductase [bacterium]